MIRRIKFDKTWFYFRYDEWYDPNELIYQAKAEDMERYFDTKFAFRNAGLPSPHGRYGQVSGDQRFNREKYSRL